MQEIAYWLISLLFVIALILALALIMKKILMPKMSGGGLLRGKTKRRLSVTESLPIDHKTRLLLIRRDDVEHLIIQGVSGETLIETGIPAKVETKQQDKSEPPAERQTPGAEADK